GVCTGTCTQGTTQCSGNGVQTCSTSGTWGATVPCTNQACVSGMCTGVCTPTAGQCPGNAGQTCSSTRTRGTAVACPGSTVCASGVCSGTLSVEYLCGNTNASSQQIVPHFKIANTGSSAVPLSTLKVRYFFTANGSATQNYVCDYALIGCS